jgi:hypothetical protein
MVYHGHVVAGRESNWVMDHQSVIIEQERKQASKKQSSSSVSSLVSIAYGRLATTNWVHGGKQQI